MIELVKVGDVLTTNGKVHEKSGVYSVNGLSPTILASCYKDPPKIIMEI